MKTKLHVGTLIWGLLFVAIAVIGLVRSLSGLVFDLQTLGLLASVILLALGVVALILSHKN